MDNNKIPLSILIADTRSKIVQIINSCGLSLSIMELIMRDAYLEISFKAQDALKNDLDEFKKQKEQSEQKQKETESDE